MNTRPEQIQRRLSGLDDIGQVVGALRAMASGNAAAARGAMQAVQHYQATIQQALLRVLPAPLVCTQGPGLVLVIGAAQGFSGGYPASIAAAAQTAAETGAGLMVLGQRSLSMLPPATRARILYSAALPAHLAQVPALASHITDQLDALGARHPGPVMLVAGRDLPGQPVQTRRLWPPEASPPATGPQPLTNLCPTALTGALLTEALFASVALALTESYRAENQARFEAMARAQTHLRDKRAAVLRDFQQARQEQMTTEMIELSRNTPDT